MSFLRVARWRAACLIGWTAAFAGGPAVARPLYNPSLEVAAENADVDCRTVGLSLALDVSGKRVALMARFDRLAQRQLAVGDISRPEHELAALALGEAHVQRATLAAHAAGGRRHAACAHGERARRDRRAAGGPAAARKHLPRPAEDLPALRVARAERADAQAGVRVARGARVPDPSISLTGGEVRAGRTRDQVMA